MRGTKDVAISDLSDELAGNVFQFVEQGNFLFVVGASQQFYRVYQTTCKSENDTKTTTRSAVESISRLQWATANNCQ